MQQKSLDFHIEQNDYFGTLATVLDLIRQDLDRREYRRHAATLVGLCEELMYLQRSHRIEDQSDLKARTSSLLTLDSGCRWIMAFLG